MAELTRAALLQLVADNIPSGQSRYVTAARMRTVMNTLIESLLVLQSDQVFSEAVTQSISQVAHGLVRGDVVRSTPAGWVKSIATTDSNAVAAGIVSAVVDANNFEIVSAGAFSSQGLLLTAGTLYYVSATTAGRLTDVKPTIANLVVLASQNDVAYFLTGNSHLSGQAGPQGLQGAQGIQGVQGVQGLSAYQVWLSAGNTGTVNQFLASLVGPAGPPADPGTLQVLVNNGTIGESAREIALSEVQAVSIIQFPVKTANVVFPKTIHAIGNHSDPLVLRVPVSGTGAWSQQIHTEGDVILESGVINNGGVDYAVVKLPLGKVYYISRYADGKLSVVPFSVIASPSTPLAAPTGLVSSSITTAGFALSWGAVSGATGYGLDVSPTSDFSTFVAGYQNLTVATTSQVVTGLIANTQYYVRVRAANVSGTSANSTVLPVTTATGVVVPTAPVTTAATLVRSGNFQTNWNAVSGATGYRLDISTVSDFSTFVVGYQNLAVAATSRLVTGLAANTQYYYRVRSETSSGTSANSNTITATTLQAPVAIGSLYSKPSGWTTLADFATNGNINLALSGSDIIVSGGSGAFSDFATFGAVNMLDDWKIVVTLEVTEITANSFGIGFGTVSQNPSLKPAVLGRFSHASPPTIFGKAFVDTGIVGGTWTNRNAGGTTNFVVGDIITFEVEYVNATVTAKIKRTGDPDTIATYTYPFPIPSSSGLFLPNTFKPGVYTFGGSIKLKTLTYSTQAYRRAKLACVGDSITQGYFANPIGNRFPSQLETIYGGINNFGGGSDTTAVILSRLPQILASQPQRVLLQIGYNDLDQGVLPATTTANYDSICSQIQAAGIDLFHLPIPSASPALSMSPIISHITTTYPSDNVIITAPQLDPDGIHPTSVGMNTIRADVVAKIGHLLL